MRAKDDLSYQANKLRKQFGEDTTSPINIFSLLQSLKELTIIFFPFSDQISGMSSRTDHGDLVIVINSKMTNGRQRFTAAHELYHLFVQKEFQSVICGKEIGSGKDEEEKNADMFASYFLAPNDALRNFIESDLKKEKKRLDSLKDIVQIEQRFGMSRQATLYRLVGDGFITLEFKNNIKGSIIASARQFGFPDDLYIPNSDNRQCFTTGSYIEYAEKLKDSGLISTGKYEELLLDAYRADIVYNFEIEGHEIYD